mmetsp:Transcript_6481/g.19665  ORF Transcript_6481/g.19665 Transcript_6481/m.19665 type:complete len:227 (-) Transcript_6481:20-700(-)
MIRSLPIFLSEARRSCAHATAASRLRSRGSITQSGSARQKRMQARSAGLSSILRSPICSRQMAVPPVPRRPLYWVVRALSCRQNPTVETWADLRQGCGSTDLLAVGLTFCVTVCAPWCSAKAGEARPAFRGTAILSALAIDGTAMCRNTTCSAVAKSFGSSYLRLAYADRPIGTSRCLHTSHNPLRSPLNRSKRTPPQFRRRPRSVPPSTFVHHAPPSLIYLSTSI